jgi:hypothetical protein
MGGSSAAPTQDPRAGEAALLSAQTGRDMLRFMQGQAGISNQWAQADRDRYLTTFRPIEDQFIRDSVNYDTPQRRTAERNRAVASVRQQGRISRGIQDRNLASMGVNPASGRAGSAGRSLAMNEQLAAVGAGNAADQMVQNEGRSRMAQAVNLGQGLAVNPGQALGMATSAGSAGFQGAMGGYGQQAQILDADYGRRMQAWEADQQGQSGLWSGLGALGGAALSNPAMFSFLSDEDKKENKRSTGGRPLRSIRNMRVEEWDYKDGAGDGGRHIGPYAQEFQRETGLGDGESINAQDAIGVTMGAVKDLDRTVRRLEARVSNMGERPRRSLQREAA